MRVYVNGEERELHVYDRITGIDYAKQVLCAQDRLNTDEYGAFMLTEEEYEHWVKLLAKQQASEDIRFAVKDRVDDEELSDYVYEETKYGTQTHEIIDMEYMCLADLQTALNKGDETWLRENGFIKTLDK